MEYDNRLDIFEEEIKDIISKNRTLDYADRIEYLLTRIANPDIYAGIVKTQVQNEIIAILIENKGGLLIAATGVGKSKIAIEYIIHSNSKKVLIVVPTEKLRDENWHDEFKKWGHNFIYDSFVTMSCYASINKIENEEYDLVILDEGHNITPNNAIFFNNNRVEQIVTLTATPPTDDIKKFIFSVLGMSKPVYTLDLDTAVKLRMVAPYEIVVVETELNRRDNNIKGGTKKNPTITNEYQEYNRLDRIFNQSKFTGRANGVKFAAINRMRFIYNLPSKTQAAKWILDNIISREERTLTFCGSIKQAGDLADTIVEQDSTGVAAYHSKSDDYYLNKFMSEQIPMLTCVKALNEGMNIDNLDNALIVQLNGSEKDLIQRLGRVLRYRDGHRGKIYITICKHTKDEDWFKKASVSLDKSNIKRIDFDELKSQHNEFT